MKSTWNSVLCVLFAFMGGILPAQSQTQRVLFLGNSYTAVNNLPQLVSDLALSAQDTLIFDSNTPGGYTFQQHCTDATSLAKIMQGNWDVVVLQEQSQIPSFPLSQVQSSCFPYARKLDSLIKLYNPCAKTMFYMTWGRKNGDASNCVNWPPVCTYAGMDSLLRLRYKMMADTNHAVVSPVGPVWRYLRYHYPGLELYQADESHPSLIGSYAAACSFYTAIFHKSPALITSNYSLSPADAAVVRMTAASVAYDSLFFWNVGKFLPEAGFGWSGQDGYQVSFTNLSEFASSYYWDFGDGTFSTQENPVKVYSGPDTVNVTLTASHCGESDMFSMMVIPALVASTAPWDAGVPLQVFPNPVQQELHIRLPGELPINSYRIFNGQGKLMLQAEGLWSGNLSVPVESFCKGIYLLMIEFDGNRYFSKFIKQ